MSGRVDTLGEQVSSLARAVERLSLVIGSSPLPASGPAGEASSAYPAPSDTSSVSGVSRSSQYNALAEEIPVVPDFCVALCGRLAAGTLSARLESRAGLGEWLLGQVRFGRQNPKAQTVATLRRCKLYLRGPQSPRVPLPSLRHLRQCLPSDCGRLQERHFVARLWFTGRS